MASTPADVTTTSPALTLTTRAPRGSPYLEVESHAHRAVVKRNGRAVPADLDAERALLGAAMITPDAAATVAALGASAFANPIHGHVAHAIAQSFAADDGRADPVLVAGFLGDADLLEHVGGNDFLVGLMADSPVSNHARYAARITEVAGDRRLMVAATELAEAARQGDHEGAARLIKALTPDPATTSRAQRLRAQLHTGTQVLELPPPVPIVDGLLFTPGVSVVYGPPKAGKSLYVLALALAVVQGERIEGRGTTRTGVLYVYAEGRAGLSLRLDAWCAHHQRQPPDGFYVITAAPSLLVDDDIDALVALIHELGVGLVILDTLARCTVGAEENSTKDMGLIVGSLDRLRDAAGHCMVVHHTGKDASKGHRGNSALLGALDTNIEVKGEGTQLTIAVKDQKDAAVSPAGAWHLVAVNRSVIAEPTGTAPAVITAREAPQSYWDCLDALRSIALPRGSSFTDWKEASTPHSKSTVLRACKWLVDHGFVINIADPDATPRYKPANNDNGEDF